ncbi:hypothetical protein EST38_g2148 [Candolleomyces aberdarensis]|uniref:Uncharacterized protein n=1 Tax=Candolleomyces aberdarensis TaxID=2316362 RepID=A0A4Q2DXF5_9AGAR|nr:hypothetical protein EST38_g2148 [Candolleomyces aberdarensis]
MSTSLTESGTSDLFSFSERVSILFVVLAAALSGISIVALMAYKLYQRREQDACGSSLFLSLIFGEALRVVGNVMTIKWMKDAAITAPTTFCYAQGILKTIGTNIIDWSTLAITIHTFAILILQWDNPPATHIANYLTLGVWLVVGIIVGITFGVRD